MSKTTRDKSSVDRITIISIAVAVFLSMFVVYIPPGPVPGHARRDIAVIQIVEIERTLEIYFKHNGFYPTTEQGLEALVTKPKTDPQPEDYPEGGYYKKLPSDPWKNPFIYRNRGEEGAIDIISCGPDGKEGTEDDITNHNIDDLNG